MLMNRNKKYRKEKSYNYYLEKKMKVDFPDKKKGNKVLLSLSL